MRDLLSKLIDKEVDVVCTGTSSLRGKVVKVDGEDKIRALNTTGLKRSGCFTDEDIQALRDAVRKLWFGKKKHFTKSLADFDLMNGINPNVKVMVEFLQRRDRGKHGRYLESLRTT
jgi:acyl-[acyl carrier protein]--UDP-N-acetylglucosamine O-acyltransferase